MNFTINPPLPPLPELPLTISLLSKHEGYASKDLLSPTFNRELKNHGHALNPSTTCTGSLERLRYHGGLTIHGKTMHLFPGEGVAMIRVIVAAFLAFLCLSCTTVRTTEPRVSASLSLIGEWERVGADDPFAGMRVRVEHLADDSLRAVIIALPPAAVAEGLSAGLVKWKNIMRIPDGTYRLQDLSMSSGKAWWDMILSFTTFDEIRLQDVESKGEIGADQTWRRLPHTT